MTGALLALLLAAPDAGALLAGRVELTADHLSSRPREGRATYSGHARAVRGTTTLTCETLEVSLDAAGEVQRLEASGGVHAVDGEREAWGDRADYDTRSGVLVLQGEPRGRAGVREVSGDRVTFVTGKDELTVERPHTVSGAEQAGGGGPVTIDADALTLRQARSTAVWRGHVRATRGRTVLTAPELEATWDAAGSITRLVARGGVTAVEPGRSARGDRADFDVQRGVVVVTGRPEAQQGRSRLFGTRVTFYPGTDRLEVEQATTVIHPEPKRP